MRAMMRMDADGAEGGGCFLLLLIVMHGNVFIYLIGWPREAHLLLQSTVWNLI